MKILIIQTAFIGDVILATAMIEQLKRFYPDAQLDFLLRKGNEGLLNGHPHLHQILIWDKKQGKYRQLWRLLGQIRDERYDWVVNCQRFAASGFLTAFSGAKNTVGFNKNPFSFLFAQSVPHRIGASTSRFGLPWQHEVDRNLSLITSITDMSPQKPVLYPSEADFLLAKEMAGDRPYVCIAPTSVWFTKQWPPEKWLELIAVLPPEITVFLLGAPSDRAQCQAIADASARSGIENLAGKLSLTASAALLKGAVMNYVNDSAPLHLASAVNAPVTAVFCSTIPEFGFTPLSDHHEIWQISAPLSCRPCGLHGYNKCPKGHFKCAYDIAPAWLSTPAE